MGGVHIKPYQELANAIVIQAAKDYMAAIRALRKNPGSKAADDEAMSLEQFFHSRWYAALTDINPEYLINKLRRKAIT